MILRHIIVPLDTFSSLGLFHFILASLQYQSANVFLKFHGDVFYLLRVTSETHLLGGGGQKLPKLPFKD